MSSRQHHGAGKKIQTFCKTRVFQKPGEFLTLYETTRARRILVVEDDPDISSLIKLHLEGGGFQVGAVADGKSGLKGAVSGDVDLVILDVGLPILSGLDVCRHLTERGSRP